MGASELGVVDIEVGFVIHAERVAVEVKLLGLTEVITRPLIVPAAARSAATMDRSALPRMALTIEDVAALKKQVRVRRWFVYNGTFEQDDAFEMAP